MRGFEGRIRRLEQVGQTSAMLSGLEVGAVKAALRMKLGLPPSIADVETMPVGLKAVAASHRSALQKLRDFLDKHQN
jgi:hypothetical protein